MDNLADAVDWLFYFSVPIFPGKLVISYSDQDRAKVAGVAANRENDTCFEADL